MVRGRVLGDAGERFPTFLEVAMRAVMLHSVYREKEALAVADLCLRPAIEPFGLMDFVRLDDIVQAGYASARERLGAWVADGGLKPIVAPLDGDERRHLAHVVPAPRRRRREPARGAPRGRARGGRGRRRRAGRCDVRAFAYRHGAKRRLSIATAGTGGVMYVYGGGVAKIVSAHVPNTEMTAEVTPGAVDNMKLLTRGVVDLAMMTGDVLDDAVRRRGAFARAPVCPPARSPRCTRSPCTSRRSTTSASDGSPTCAAAASRPARPGRGRRRPRCACSPPPGSTPTATCGGSASASRRRPRRSRTGRSTRASSPRPRRTPRSWTSRACASGACASSRWTT
jgi:hypothetical protein